MTNSFPTRRSSDMIKSGVTEGLTSAIGHGASFGKRKRPLRRGRFFLASPKAGGQAASAFTLSVTTVTRAVSGEATSPASLISASLLLAARSEEHTSDLQSLMRISYAVFCLK